MKNELRKTLFAAPDFSPNLSVLNEKKSNLRHSNIVRNTSIFFFRQKSRRGCKVCREISKGRPPRIAETLKTGARTKYCLIMLHSTLQRQTRKGGGARGRQSQKNCLRVFFQVAVPQGGP